MKTAKSRSSVLQIVVWFFFVAVIFSLGVGLGTKFVMTKKFARDDILLLVTLIIYLGQCISVSVAASSGLGRHTDTLTDAQVTGFLTAEYASIPLMISTLALIKGSITIFIASLCPISWHRKANRILRIIIALWMTASIFTSLFQCGIPNPWDYIHEQRCFNRRAWWTFVGSLNILTDIYIIVLEFIIIIQVQIAQSKKLVVLSIFASRLSVVILAVIQLISFWQTYPTSDAAYASWLPDLYNQAVLCSSFVTACLPYIRPFMESLEVNIIRVRGSEDDIPRSTDGSGGHYLSSMGSSNSRSKSRLGVPQNQGRELDILVESTVTVGVGLQNSVNGSGPDSNDRGQLS